MDLSKLATALGITAKLPDKLLEFAENYQDDGSVACDVTIVDALQQEFGFFGEYYETIRRAAEKINESETLSTWVKVTAKYALESDFAQARNVPVPPTDGTETMDFLPLFMLLPQIPLSIAEYRRRGFPENELRDLLWGYLGSINIVRKQTGRPGVNQVYYNWLHHYTKAILFKVNGLQFEKFTMPLGACWLQNKKTGELIPFVLDAVFCGDGKHRLGTAGFTECDETFHALFEEDEDNYYGYPTYHCVVSSQRETFPKTEWECIARPGDEAVNMHIPKGSDISRENTIKACEKALEILKERYPETKAKILFCASWLLDPTLSEMLGENSNITAFQNCFTRYPTKDGGQAVFSFAFVRRCADLNDLPEDTSLQRKIKAHYLNGNYIYTYTGVFTG